MKIEKLSFNNMKLRILRKKLNFSKGQTI